MPATLLQAPGGLLALGGVALGVAMTVRQLRPAATASSSTCSPGPSSSSPVSGCPCATAGCTPWNSSLTSPRATAEHYGWDTFTTVTQGQLAARSVDQRHRHEALRWGLVLAGSSDIIGSCGFSIPACR